MDLKQIESKWQKIWADTGLYKFNRDRIDKKWYVLEMFSYPSGAKLHAGHWYNYGPADTYARFKKMQGYEVFQPMGFDAFGLPAENYAIKTGIHPQDSTMKNIETMENQLKKSVRCTTGITNFTPALPSTTNGRSGFSCNFTKRVLPTARKHPSTGVLPATRCLQTSRSFRANANVAEARS